MRRLERSKLIWPLLAFVLVLGCSREPAPSEPMAEAADDTAVEHALKHADPTYVCPMHPQIVQNEPGSCPICGMPLVEVPAGDGAEADDPDAGAVRIDPVQVQNIGVVSVAARVNSSAKSRMVTAGITKEKVMGSREKKFLRVAWSNTKKVEKKNHPVTSRKMEMTM